jgi:hypothetical protein
MGRKKKSRFQSIFKGRGAEGASYFDIFKVSSPSKGKKPVKRKIGTRMQGKYFMGWGYSKDMETPRPKRDRWEAYDGSGIWFEPVKKNGPKKNRHGKTRKSVHAKQRKTTRRKPKKGQANRHGNWRKSAWMKERR